MFETSTVGGWLPHLREYNINEFPLGADGGIAGDVFQENQTDVGLTTLH